MRSRAAWVAAGVVLLAFGLRLYRIDWGLPQVYEEAYPFKKAWPMWGWEPGTRFDLNPHFFNYPTLYFYLQFLGQGLLFLFLRVLGRVHSVLDYRVLYTLDKTPFYLVGRSITAAFGAATVLVTYQVGRRVGGAATGVLAALLLAVNAVHIAKCQVIEVDVPLTFFLMLTLLYALRILEDPRPRNYVLAGICAGLATSTKYSGLFLVLPILLAHVMACWPAGTERAAPAGRARRGRDRRAGTAAGSGALRRVFSRPLLLAGTAFVAALFLTSPYILLDFSSFWEGFNYERLHMKIGHFGLDRTPAIVYYAKVLVGSLLGWPLALASLAALVWLAGVRRYRWAMVLAVFPIVYVAVISSFSMKAERYILPLVPIAAILTSAAAIELVPRIVPRRRFAAAAVVGLGLGLAAPTLVAYARTATQPRDDTRTLARQWLEANVPSGAYIVTEAYGPEPLSALDLANLSLDVRERIQGQLDKSRLYAMTQLPMLQVRPEFMSPFYDLALYDDLADYIVTSSFVSSRYRKDPVKFRQQVGFYDELDRRYTLVREFGPADGTGPTLKIYRNPRQTQPFAARGTVPSPVGQPRIKEYLPGTVGMHYYRLALNFETFKYYVPAAETYLLSWSSPEGEVSFRRDSAVSAIRCLLLAKHPTEAMQVLEQVARVARSPAEVQFWQNLREQLLAGAASNK
jgi:4-amino-4-deoxy-L-arabinose transferase-like glycosyltransferase